MSRTKKLQGENPGNEQTSSRNFDLLSREHFEEVLDRVQARVFSGKGNERHGHGDRFEDQPWVVITKKNGEGFPLGQMSKKSLEISSLTSTDRRIKEAMDVIVYAAMFIMMEEYNEGRQDVFSQRTDDPAVDRVLTHEEAIRGISYALDEPSDFVKLNDIKTT